jgi:membrane associated rhomboid family serine protease
VSLLIVLYLLLQIVTLLPIKDRRSRQRDFPWMTFSLVGLNVFIHFWVAFLTSRQPVSTEEASWTLLYPYMEVPNVIMSGQGLGALSVLSSGFLHGGWGHLLGNMFMLWFFGRKVEDATGPVRFGMFYLACLFTASLTSVLARYTLSPLNASMPGLGASGAISGLMAAYLFLYSNEKVLTIIFPIPWAFWLPVWIYIVQTIMTNAVLGQIVQEMTERLGEFAIGVNVFAHLGGILGGLILIYFFLHPEVLAQRR